MTPERDHRDVEALAPHLGAEAANGIDPQKTAWAVLARLRREPQRRPWWQRAKLVPLAAAATVLLASGIAIEAWRSAGGSGMPFPLPAEIEELASSELTAVLDSLELEVPMSEIMPATLADLSEAELAQLLESMEG
jgi:hypothetical protein